MNKCYCVNCAFLELRPVFGEIGLTGKYVFSGTRFKCNKHDKYFPYDILDKSIEYEYCFDGEKSKHGYLDKIEKMLEQTKKRQCELCPYPNANCSHCKGVEMIEKIKEQSMNLKERQK